MNFDQYNYYDAVRCHLLEEMYDDYLIDGSKKEYYWCANLPEEDKSYDYLYNKYIDNPAITGRNGVFDYEESCLWNLQGNEELLLHAAKYANVNQLNFSNRMFSYCDSLIRTYLFPTVLVDVLTDLNKYKKNSEK